MQLLVRKNASDWSGRMQTGWSSGAQFRRLLLGHLGEGLECEWRTPLLLAEGAQCDGVMGVKNLYPSKNGVPGVPLMLKAMDYVAFRAEHLFI